MIEIQRLLAKDRDMNGLFVRLPRKDALELIESLAYQIGHNNPNTNRTEWSHIKGIGCKFNYFTISVIPETEGK